MHDTSAWRWPALSSAGKKSWFFPRELSEGLQAERRRLAGLVVGVGAQHSDVHVERRAERNPAGEAFGLRFVLGIRFFGAWVTVSDRGHGFFQCLTAFGPSVTFLEKKTGSAVPERGFNAFA